MTPLSGDRTVLLRVRGGRVEDRPADPTTRTGGRDE